MSKYLMKVNQYARTLEFGGNSVIPQNQMTPEQMQMANRTSSFQQIGDTGAGMIPGFGQYYQLARGAASVGQGALANYGHTEYGADGQYHQRFNNPHASAANQALIPMHQQAAQDFGRGNYGAGVMDLVGAGFYKPVMTYFGNSDTDASNQKWNIMGTSFKRGNDPAKANTATTSYNPYYNQGYKNGGTIEPMIINNDLIHFNGPSHANGGINLFHGGEIIAQVEGGETMKNNFVYSDNLKVPGTKTTFATASKKYDNEDNIKGSISYNSNERMLSKLRDKNQALIDQKEAKRVMRNGGKIPMYFEGGVPFQPKGFIDNPDSYYGYEKGPLTPMVEQDTNVNNLPYYHSLYFPQPSSPELTPRSYMTSMTPISSNTGLQAEKDARVPTRVNTGSPSKMPVKQSGYDPNQMAELAPALYNLGMSLSPIDKLNPKDYQVNSKLPYRTYNNAPAVANIERSYRIANENARNSGNTSTGSYIARNLANQANKAKSLNQLEMERQNYNNSMMNQADMYNNQLDAANKQMALGILDYNNRLLGNKQNFGAAAATNIGQYGANQRRYGMINKQMAGQQAAQNAWMNAYGDMYNNYTINPDGSITFKRR